MTESDEITINIFNFILLSVLIICVSMRGWIENGGIEYYKMLEVLKASSIKQIAENSFQGCNQAGATNSITSK